MTTEQAAGVAGDAFSPDDPFHLPDVASEAPPAACAAYEDDYERLARVDRAMDRAILRAPCDIPDEARRAETLTMFKQVCADDPTLKLTLREALDLTDELARTSFRNTADPALVDALAAEAVLTMAGYVPLAAPESKAASRRQDFERPAIRQEEHRLRENAREAECAMLDDPNASPVFCFAGQYAVVQKINDATFALTGAPQYRIKSLRNVPDLRSRMMASAKFFSWVRKDWFEAKPTDSLVQELLTYDGGNAPPLRALIAAPVVYEAWTPEKRVYGYAVEEPGYDAATGLYATFGATDFPRLRSFAQNSEAALAKQMAAEALAYLREQPFGEFPFDSEVDFCAAVAALITVLQRPVCEIAPGFLVTAPAQGTGKSLLTQIIGLIATGQAVGSASWTKDEELRKSTASHLQQGARAIRFDNVPDGTSLDSNEIAKFITSSVIEDRRLGVSEIMRLPNCAVLFFSGNNVGLEGDLPSRIIRVELDARTERPDQKTYRRPALDQWCLANRGEIVSRALTIVKAYLDCGAPDVGGKPTRFPTWDRLVRRAIMFAGGADVGEKFTQARDTDPKLELLRPVLELWLPCLGSDPVTTRELIRRTESTDFLSSDGAAFVQSLRTLAGMRRTDAFDAHRLGGLLAKNHGKIVGGLRLERSQHRQNHAQWTVVQV